MHSDEQELEADQATKETHPAVTEEVHETDHASVHYDAPEATHVVAEEVVHVTEPKPSVVHEAPAVAVVASAAGPIPTVVATVNPNKAAMAEKIAEYTKAGTNHAAVFAFGKTGILVTAENSATLSATEITAWEVAMNEYFAAHPGVKS